MNSPRGEIRKRKSHLSFVVKHQGFMYFVLWFLSLKQVFLSRIRFILLIIFRAMFLSILQKKPKDENKMFSISLFLLKETLIKNFVGRLLPCDVSLFFTPTRCISRRTKTAVGEKNYHLLHRALKKPLLQCCAQFSSMLLKANKQNHKRWKVT